MSTQVARRNPTRISRSSRHVVTSTTTTARTTQTTTTTGTPTPTNTGTTSVVKSRRSVKGRRPSMETAISLRYDIINRIGAGSMGTVFQVMDRTDSRLHALKVVRKADVSDPLGRLSMRREMTALRRFRHPNIVRFHHAYEDGHFIFLATEYCSQGDLTSLLRRTSVGLPEAHALSIMRQVFLALSYLHAHGVSHRDVKLQNILIAPDGSIRLADLGLVHWRRPQDAKLSTRFCGTVEYAAPEVVMRKEYVPQYTDMWACGVTLYMLLTRSVPFKHVMWDELSFRGINLNIVSLLGSESLAHIHLPCRQLLQGLLAAYPNSRISAEQAVALCDEGIAALNESANQQGGVRRY